MAKRQKKQQPRKKKEYIRINHNITNDEVRLVGGNVEPGVYTIKDALNISDGLELDLVEISKGDVPVCRIVDFGKYQFEKKKKQKEMEKKQKENVQKVKEVQFGPNTDEHDYLFKKRHAENFIKNNDIVKAVVFFKGREMTFKEKGQLILMRLAKELLEISIPDNAEPKMEGNRMIMMIRPKKNK